MKPYLLATSLVFALLALTGCPKRTPQQRLDGALRTGNQRSLDKAIAAGGDLKAVDADGNTALHHLAKAHSPKPELVDQVLAAGVDVKAKNKAGETAWDVRWGDERRSLSERPAYLLAALLKAGHPAPDAEAKDDEGQTFLHRAARRCEHAGLLEALVKEHGFAADAPDANGWTPLHHAAWKGNYEGAQGLIAAGANVNAETTKQVGDSYQKGETTLWRYRIEPGSRPANLYHRPWTRGTPDFKALLAEHGGAEKEGLKNVLP
jgi:hypothetical protein